MIVMAHLLSVMANIGIVYLVFRYLSTSKYDIPSGLLWAVLVFCGLRVLIMALNASHILGIERHFVPYGVSLGAVTSIVLFWILVEHHRLFWGRGG